MNKLRVFMLYITLVTCSLAAHGAVVKGVIDKSNTGIKGWACITGKTDSIRVHVYIGGPAGTAGVPGFSIPASNSSEAAVDTQCLHSGIHGNHRFSLPLSAAQIKAYKGKPVYVYGIGMDGVSTKLLSGSGVIKVPNPMGIIGGIYEGKTIYGWACLKENTSSVAVDLYAGNKKMRTVTANQFSQPEIDAECGHSGYRANHRFSYTLTASDKLRYGGSSLSAVVSGSNFTNVKLVNSYKNTIPAPIPKGIIGGIDKENAIYGWACLEENTSSVAVDLYAGNKKMRTVTANMFSEPEIDAECGHSGHRANHRFGYTLTASDKLLYGGSKLGAVVTGSNFADVKLANSGILTIPSPPPVPPVGKVTYTQLIAVNNEGDQVDPVAQVGQVAHIDQVALQWDYSDTASCDVINATVFSFAGSDGTNHNDLNNDLDLLEEKLGMGCIRLIRVNVNPDGDGYWENNDSYHSASNLMTHIITNSINNTWNAPIGPYAQGKIIVAGISAGGTIAASALEFSDVYRTYVAKTIMLSAPLGYDVSFECQKIENSNIKGMLDTIFHTADESPETSCAHPDPENGILEVSSDKDVVNADAQPAYRSYLEFHEVTIFVSEKDAMGCEGNNLTSCGWSAIDAVYRYVDKITGGYPGQIFAPGPTTEYPHVLYELRGSDAVTHAGLWHSEYVRKQVCLHAFAVVNKDTDKIPVAYCE